MDLRELAFFVAVAEERHFGRAAERLHVSQPPVSQTIRRLEAELGVELLRRTTRSVEVAPAGEVLLVRARAILAAVAQADEDTRRAARGELGRLAVGFTGSATYALLPRVAALLRDAMPGTVLDLRSEMLTPAQVEALLDGSLDLGVLRPPVRERELAVEVVRRERLLAVLPHDHRLAGARAVPLEELAEERFITYPSHVRSVVHEAVVSACGAHGFLPHVAMEVAETSTLVSCVAAGLGVSLVPESVSHMSIDGAVYRPLESADAGVELALAWRRDDPSPVLARALDVVGADLRSSGQRTDRAPGATAEPPALPHVLGP